MSLFTATMSRSDDAAPRTAQLACDLKFLGVPILYSWASANDPRRYSKDEDTVGLTVKRLTAFLSKLIQSSGAEQIATLSLIAWETERG